MIFPNLINQNFDVTSVNKVWYTDFIYLFLTNGMVRYNCTIIDLKDCSVIASLNGNHITSELAIQTLQIAIKRHNPGKGLILHSDYTEFSIVRIKEVNLLLRNLMLFAKNRIFNKV